ncbi:hypothetical protein SLEP1_g30264 [Rubroshorea leprosula]|uniref:Uncharacterized protein n=1 Tax=Rubroshorea leprosula TaxID=152421 RepID=A0AAV5K5J6_9ROSI|nr:hypothetical protein SLEP1_g30264 [Rubroshorea leprosula]
MPMFMPLIGLNYGKLNCFLLISQYQEKVFRFGFGSSLVREECVEPNRMFIGLQNCFGDNRKAKTFV